MSKKTVYISSNNIESAKLIAEEFVAAGHRVVSTWHESDEPRETEIQRTDAADLNVTQITEETDVLVLDCPDHLVPGGCYVEAGVAIGAGIPVVALNVKSAGDLRRNLLLHHPSVIAAANAADAIAMVEEISIVDDYDDDGLGGLDSDDFDDDFEDFDDEEDDADLDD
jgi:nucleoside 2-deoxyribosyltransferase